MVYEFSHAFYRWCHNYLWYWYGRTIFLVILLLLKQCQLKINVRTREVLWLSWEILASASSVRCRVDSLPVQSCITLLKLLFVLALAQDFFMYVIINFINSTMLLLPVIWGNLMFCLFGVRWVVSRSVALLACWKG